MRDPRVDPRVGDIAAHREQHCRKVVQTFTDACGAPCVVYESLYHVVKLSTWRKQMKGAEIRHAANE